MDSVTFTAALKALYAITTDDLKGIGFTGPWPDHFVHDPAAFFINHRDLGGLVFEALIVPKAAALLGVGVFDINLKQVDLFSSMPPDPTAQAGPLTIGQQIVASWETDAIAEPCELAAAIDRAIAEARK